MVEFQVWIPDHQLSPACWCRPTVENDAEGRLTVHRQVILRPDNQERAFIPLLSGPPV